MILTAFLPATVLRSSGECPCTSALGLRTRRYSAESSKRSPWSKVISRAARSLRSRTSVGHRHRPVTPRERGASPRRRPPSPSWPPATIFTPGDDEWNKPRSAMDAMTNTRSNGSTRTLVDPFGRDISYLRVSVTDRCDFRCVYCMSENMTFLPKADILSLEELDRLCSAFVARGVRKLRL